MRHTNNETVSCLIYLIATSPSSRKSRNTAKRGNYEAVTGHIIQATVKKCTQDVYKRIVFLVVLIGFKLLGMDLIGLSLVSSLLGPVILSNVITF
jgi:hypothetical protein